MPANARITLRRAPAPLALMSLIFFLSAQSDLDTGLGLWDTVLRKGGHLAVYGALTALWWWALSPLGARALPLAAAIAFAYAISDEYHQSLVSGRSGEERDVTIDAAGILAAAAVLRYHRRPHRAARAGSLAPGDE